MIEAYDLSPQQKHLWQLQRGSYDPVYRTICSVLIGGAIRPELLRSALEDVVREHEILRTTFVRTPGHALPAQVVNPDATFAWDVHLLTSSTPAQVSEGIAEAIDAMRARDADVENGPTLSAAWIAVGDRHSHLLLSLPSLCADPETMAILGRKLGQAYATRSGLAPAVVGAAGASEDEKTIQYADVAQWQNELLGSDEAGRAFWAEQMSGAPPALPGTSDSAGTGAPFRPRELSYEIPSALQAGIRRFAAHSETSSEAVLLASLQVLLHRMTGDAEFVVGVGSNGRTYDELRDVPGPFAKTLPMKCTLHEAIPFSQLVQRTAGQLRQAADHQQYFSPGSIGELQASTPSRPVLPIGFDYRTEAEVYDDHGLRLALGDRARGLSVADGARLSLTSYGDRFVLRVSAVEDLSGLTLVWCFDEGAVAEDRIARLSVYLQVLLADAVDRPDVGIGALNIVGDDERRRLTDEFSRSPATVRAAHGPVQCLHKTIEDRASAAGERDAVRWKDGTLTYAELNARANQLARHLQGLGVGPDVPVGLCCERSPEMVIGILGILKAGGAYVPLDPSYPGERLAFMLQDSGARVLVSQQRFDDRVGHHEARVVHLDTDWRRVAEMSTAPLRDGVSLDDLAYVIYTSGSTGQPKGVAVTHGNLATSTLARLDYYDDPVDNYLLLSSFSFDSSVAGIFWTLSQGGALVLPEDKTEREPQDIAALIEAHTVSHVLMLPSLYGLLLRQTGARQLSSLKVVVVAGEECPVGLVERHHQMLPHTRLFNEYGPTEATVWSTVHECRAEPLDTVVPIGRPIAGASAFILTSLLSPVPVGVAGELYIGGLGIARGYLHRDELTRDRFLADPFSGRDGGRLYKTGDRARFRADGAIEFLGRVDGQVKIRGYRVELGEVEAAVRKHGAVAECVVVAREDAPGVLRLVAYIVRAGAETPTVGDLRSFLVTSIPDYMVPSAFVYLGDLPLTPSGKVDRHALPDPDQSRLAVDGAPAAARTPLERYLVNTWGEALGVRTIGVNDDFFEIGGNSIQAAIIANELQSTLGERVHVATLFHTPTVSDLAAYLEKLYPDATARWAELLEQPASERRAGVAQAPAGTPGTGHVEHLTDEQVTSMLEKMLAGGDADG